MFIRTLENRTGNELTIEELIDTLRGYNFQHFEGRGASQRIQEIMQTIFFMKHLGLGLTIRSMLRKI